MEDVIDNFLIPGWLVGIEQGSSLRRVSMLVPVCSGHRQRLIDVLSFATCERYLPCKGRFVDGIEPCRGVYLGGLAQL